MNKYSKEIYREEFYVIKVGKMYAFDDINGSITLLNKPDHASRFEFSELRRAAELAQKTGGEIVTLHILGTIFNTEN